MRYSMFFKPLALIASLLGAMAAPAAESDFNNTSAVLVERGTSPPTAAIAKWFRVDVLNQHNAERKLHHVKKLRWNTKLAAYAQVQANKCKSAHSSGPYGENLFSMGPARDVYNWHQQTKEAVEAWISEYKVFPWNSPQFTVESGHFSQIVWKATTEVGCAWNNHDCGADQDNVYLFCEYSPRGNVATWFKDNVFHV